MSGLRQRKLKDEGQSRPFIGARTMQRPRSMRRLFVILTIAALMLTYFTGFFTTRISLFDGIAKSLGYQGDYYYAVVIDAGSSGSRVLAYKFYLPYSVFGQSSLNLVEEYFSESKPGLSSYAEEPAKGAESIVNLIEKAEFLIPVEKRSTTPLLVRATAGLRLLPPAQASELVDDVQKAILGLGYDGTATSVEIMEGSDEGIFIWYTVNLLHDRKVVNKTSANNTLAGQNIKISVSNRDFFADFINSDKTLAALDLGGGSTQITYDLNNEEMLEMPKADQFLVPASGVNMSVYTNSYLNLGLLAARYGVLRMEAKNADSKTFTSSCVDPIIQNEPWKYANIQYHVSGAPRPKKQSAEGRWMQCHALVKRYILNTMDWKPTHPPRADVAAMSYYYDIAADAGMIDVMQGGMVTVNNYRAYGIVACGESNVDQPWACLNLVYVATLLGDGLRVPQNKPISLYKKVNGHEVSWALGLAYTSVLERLPSN